MLQFRLSIALKELFQANLKRPLTGIVRNKASPATICFSTACPDVTALPKLKTLHAGSRHVLRSAYGIRSFCTETEGSVTASETTKDDGSGKETEAEK